jgi:hypothetical protein
MSWSAGLNVALGLIFLYLVFSVAVSRINEFVTSRLQWRAKGLERALFTMLGGSAAPPISSPATSNDGTPVDATEGVAASAGTAVLSARAVKDHPIVATFESTLGKGRRISYLASRAFSAAVLDILAPPATVILDSIPLGSLSEQEKGAAEQLRAHPDAAHLTIFDQALDDQSPLRKTILPRLSKAIEGDVLEQARAIVLALPPENPARRPLTRMLTDAMGDRDVFRAKLEHWYDDEMARLSGWYKRRVQCWLIAYGIVLTVAFNVDSISIAQTLWRSPVEQAAAAQAAANNVEKTTSSLDTSVAAIKGLALPLGWTAPHDGSAISADPRHVPEAAVGPWALKALGLAITTFALAFGAPFWFDVLGKLTRVRNTGSVATTEDARGP